MASIEYDNNCLNCQHRHASATLPRCVDCLKNAKQGSQFPGWTPVGLKEPVEEESKP